ncbi:MAG: hypothetical protein P8X69_08920 [Maritimibacter sp.]
MPEDGDASCVLHLPDAPGPVTFLAGGGLRKALFKGSEGWRKRFVAAAALLLGRHLLPRPTETDSVHIDPDLLAEVDAALQGSLIHGLRGDPRLAQERLFDLAISARADAAPRLAALLRIAARHAGRLARRDAEADPSAWLAELAECHALARALRKAPGNPVFLGQLRREYAVAEPHNLAVLGVGQWTTPSGARGLTIHGWDGNRFLSSGPARAAGMDPSFAPRQAYRQAWWRGMIPERMAGHILHLSAPQLSSDGVLSGQTVAANTGATLALERLPFHHDWAALQADLTARQGIGLRAAMRPVPALIRPASLAKPGFDAIEQGDRIEVADGAGCGLVLHLPDATSGAVAYAAQHRLRGALIEALRDGEGLSYRLIALFYGDPVRVWNVTLEPAPKELRDGGRIERLWARAHRMSRPNPDAPRPNRVALLAEQGLQALADGVCTPGAQGRRPALAVQAEALGLAHIARRLASAEPRDGAAVLSLAWELVLIRRAAQGHRMKL